MNELNSAIKEKNDIWSSIKNSKLPVVLYGMGDGAVKLLAILKSRGITPVGIFASDEFVRYNEFCSYTVKKLSDIEREHEDFIILVAFATRLDEVRERIFSLASRHMVLVPDINVARDPLEVFDTGFCEKNYSRLNRVYNALSDERSRKTFAALINFKLSGKLQYLAELEELRKQEILPYDADSVTSFADFGAYTGDTLIEAFNIYKNLEKAVCFEPDARSFKKLEKTALALGGEISLFNALAHSRNDELELFEASGRNTIVQKNAFENGKMQKKKVRAVKALRADHACKFVPSLIKMDVEGCESEALEGCRGFFDTAFPILRISIYHNNRDLFEIFEKIESIKKGYKFTLSQKCAYIPAWDIELVAHK